MPKRLLSFALTLGLSACASAPPPPPPSSAASPDAQASPRAPVTRSLADGFPAAPTTTSTAGHHHHHHGGSKP